MEGRMTGTASQRKAVEYLKRVNTWQWALHPEAGDGAYLQEYPKNSSVERYHLKKMFLHLLKGQMPDEVYYYLP
jgi:hypothetical protein